MSGGLRTAALVLLLAGIALAGPMGCGKRGPLKAPEEPTTTPYPRSYPAT